MIDRRKIKDKTQDNFPILSDTDIMINFSDFLNSSYKYLLKIDAGCYDPFDDFANAAYFEMVYSVLSYKYNIMIKYMQHHRYGMTLHTYRKIFHIEMTPKQFPLKLEIDKEEITFTENDVSKNMLFVFKSFCDGKHILCGSYEKDELVNMKFDKVEIDIIDEDTGFVFRKYKNSKIFLDKNCVSYNLVIEDYDEEEHKYYKNIKTMGTAYKGLAKNFILKKTGFINSCNITSYKT